MWMIWRHVFAVVAVVLSALPAMAQVQQYGWQTLQSTTGTGSGTELDINGYNSVSIDVEMTSTGTVTLKIKGDGSYRDLTCTSAGDTSAALVTSVTSSTQLVCSTFGLSKIQTPITANGGTITVKARVSNTMARRGSVGGGGGGSGDVTDVWGCTTGNCDALTGAAGDSFDAGSADTSKPATRSTALPVTCGEGQVHHDTDSGGSETYVCTAANTWTKLAATSEVGGGVADGDKGDVTVSGAGATWTINNGVVTLGKMADMSTSRFLGRVTAGAGVPEALTGTQATTLLDPFTSSLKGLAPASGGGTSNFLRADGVWAAPPGGGGSSSALAPAVVTVGAGNSPYTVLATDYLVMCDTTLASRIINLHAATTNHIIAVSNVGANTCTINRAGTDTIVGDTVVVLAARHDGVTMIADGVSKWTLH